MISSQFHPNRQVEKHKKATAVKIEALFNAVPKAYRLEVGKAFNLKQSSESLGSQMEQELRSYDLFEGYRYAIEETKHRSISSELSASKRFIELCAVELSQSQSSLWDQHELLSLSSPASVPLFLDAIEANLKAAQIEQISSEPRSYYRDGEMQRIQAHLEHGRQLLSSGRVLEFNCERFDSISAEPDGPAWDDLCLLTKYRPMALVPLLGRIHDPMARNHLSSILTQNSSSYQLGLSFIRSKGQAAVAEGLELCLGVLGRIVHVYATRKLSPLKNQGKIRDRRKTSLLVVYKELWREVAGSGLIQTGYDLVLIKKGFSLGPGTWAAQETPELSEAGYRAFVEVGSDWLRMHSTEALSLARCFASPQREIELAVELLGNCLLAQSLDVAADGESRRLLDTATRFFFDDIKDEDTVYKRRLVDRRSVSEINAWVRFFSGVRLVMGDAWLLDLFAKNLAPLRQRITNRWKPSDRKYGTEDSLTYGCLVFLYSHANGRSPNISQVHQMLSMLDGVTPTDARGNWEALLGILYRNIGDPVVKAFIESRWFLDGIPPDFYAVIPEPMLANNPDWQARARELVADYREFYPDQIEEFREQLTARGLL